MGTMWTSSLRSVYIHDVPSQEKGPYLFWIVAIQPGKGLQGLGKELAAPCWVWRGNLVYMVIGIYRYMDMDIDVHTEIGKIWILVVEFLEF